MDAKVVAQQIFEALGGNENIISLVLLRHAVAVCTQ